MRTISIIKYTFTVVGLGLLVGAYYLFASTQEFVKNASTSDGTVVEVVRSRSSDSVTYRPVVEFKIKDGSIIEFTSSTGSNPPSYSKGEIVEVLYLESHPEEAAINGFFSLWGGSVIVAGLGAVFFLVGSMILLWGGLKDKKVEYLRKNWFPVKAKFQSVEINSSVEVNGRRPYIICAQWKNPATSEVHLFSSENIWFDPTDYINADELTVLIERDNPKKYYVDISFLPKVAS